MTIASKFLFSLFDAGVQHRDDVFADGVHLAVEFDAQHAVAEIDQRGAGIFLDHAVGALDIRQHQGVRARFRESDRSCMWKSKYCLGMAARLGVAIERRRPAGEPSLDVLRQCAAFLLQPAARPPGSPAHPTSQTGRACGRNPSGCRDRSLRCGPRSPESSPRNTGSSRRTGSTGICPRGHPS